MEIFPLKKITHCFLIITGLILLQTTFAKAQQNYGTITGYVNSEQTPISHAYVKLTELNKKTTSNQKGYFSFEHIPAGAYTIEISHMGMIKQKNNILLKAGEQLNLDFNLKPQLNNLDEINVMSKKNKTYVPAPSSSLRLQTPLLEIPQNIQIISKQTLEEQQLFNVADGMSRNVSGVRTLSHQQQVSAPIYVRGFSSGSLRNGMSVSGSFGPLREDMAFIDRVEFVKGPAGFMMGNTQPGGFYNIVTKKPTGQNQSSVRLTMGSFNTYRFESDIDSKLTEDGKLAFRLNVMAQSVGSHSMYTTTNGLGINPSLKYQVSDQTTVTMEYTYLMSSFTGGLGSYSYSMKGFKDAPRNMTYSDPIVDPTKVNDHSTFANVNHKIDSNWQLTGQLGYSNYKMRGASIYPVFNGIDDNGSFNRTLSVNDADNTAVLGQVFVNGKFKTGPLAHRLLAGMDMGSKKYLADWSVLPNLIGPAFNIYNPVYGNLTKADIPVVDRSKSLRERAGRNKNEYAYTALYFQDELSFLHDRVRFSFGGRYTRTSKFDMGNKGNEVNNQAFTPRVGLNVTVAKNTTAYAVYDQTFQEQTGVLASGDSPDPSRGSNKEIGLKREWADGKWSTTLAAYKVTKSNLLTPADPANPGISVLTGEAASKGIEFDLKGQILPNLSLILNYAYTDAKITKDNNTARIGNNLDGTAKHITNGWATYRFSDGPVQGLGFSLGYQFEAQRAGWPVVANKNLPDNFFSLDAGVSYVQEKFSISLLGSNLTDRYNYTGHFPGAWGYKHYGWKTLPPANYKLSIGYKF